MRRDFRLQLNHKINIHLSSCMKSILLPAIAATFLLELLSISSRAENNPGDTRRSDAVSSQDKDFVNEVGRGLMRDSALAAIAAQRTRSPDVRIFATRVSAQREQARQRLRQLAGDLRLGCRFA